MNLGIRPSSSAIIKIDFVKGFLDVVITVKSNL